MNALMLLVLLALATQRVTRAITTDKVSEKLRIKLSHREYPSYFVNCGWCVSFWVAGLLTLVTVIFVGLPVPVLMWFAAASIAGILEEWV